MSPAIGDSLLLMIVAHNLMRRGFQVSIFGSHIHALRAWFPEHDIRPALNPEQATAILAGFDLVIQLHDSRPLPKLCEIHPAAVTLEHLCRQKRPQSMAQRLEEFCRDQLGLENVVKSNGMTAPNGLVHRRHPRRVAIHPTASTPDKCWLPGRFVALALQLRGQGYEPYFVVGPAERSQWEHVLELGLELPDLGSLDNVAARVYESGWFIGNDSGIGHLASNMHVPTLSLFKRKGSAQTWRPDWGPGKVLIGSPFVPTGRLKELLWKYTLTPKRVLRNFARFQTTQASGGQARGF